MAAILHSLQGIQKYRNTERNRGVKKFGELKLANNSIKAMSVGLNINYLKRSQVGYCFESSKLHSENSEEAETVEKESSH